MKNATWTNIFAGDVVKFRYKSKGDTAGVDRTVICLDPRYRYRKKSTGRIVEFFIGIQIDTTGIQRVMTQMELKKLIELLGESEEELSKVTYNDERRMVKIYRDLRQFLKKIDVFRTFHLRECRKRRVFLMDKYSNLNKLQIKNISKKLINESRTQAQLEVSEEGI